MTTQVFKHQSLAGLSTTNLIFDKDMLEAALDGHENAEEILAILGQSVDREDNGFRSIDKAQWASNEGDDSVTVSAVESGDRAESRDDPLNQLISEESGTSQILDHVSFYLGENRAWRNGWNAKSFLRHQKASRKAQADNGVVWGAFSMIPTAEEKAAKVARVAQARDNMAAKKAKRLAKLAARRG